MARNARTAQNVAVDAVYLVPAKLPRRDKTGAKNYPMAVEAVVARSNVVLASADLSSKRQKSVEPEMGHDVAVYQSFQLANLGAACSSS